MKNLENYGVLEMNAKEISENEGGWWMPRVTISGGWFNWPSLYGDNTNEILWV